MQVPFAMRHRRLRVPRAILVGAVVVSAAIAAACLGWYFLRPVSTASGPPPTDSPPPTDHSSVVELAPTKQAIADIHTTTAEMHELTDVRRVPGKIGYNTTRRVAVKLPVGGVLTRVLVQQGQRVEKGEQLAVLNSTEVGLARTELVSAESDVELARKELTWAKEIATNLQALRDLLKSHPEMEAVEKQFDDLLLGQHRDRVLSAYSKLLVAEKVSDSTESVASSGGVSGLLVQQRRSTREVASAQFRSELEQSLFDASQQQIRAQARFDKTEHLRSVAQQKLQLLLGQYAEISPKQQDDTICELIVRSPINGIVEERLVTDELLFTASQTLFTITDTETLWVSAHIYDQQWAALGDVQVKEVMIEAPAVPDHSVPGRVLFSAVTTSVDSGAVPLVAEFPNVHGHFKPGMFAWVSIPVSNAKKVLAVPVGAIARHEQKTFVFVEERPGTYRRVDVELGPTVGDFVEITHGLQPGQTIVDRGVFTLKSELLLGEIES